MTTSVDKRVFKTKDLCDIIRSCSIAGVSVFKYEGLYLKFTPTNVEPTPDHEDVPRQVILPTNVDIDPSLPDVDPELVEELELDQMMYDDPHGYEQKMLREIADGEVDR